MESIRWIYSSLITLTLICSGCSEIKSYDECFTKDSISCLQMQLYQNAKELMSLRKIDIVSGVSLVNDRPEINTEMVTLEEQIENATDIFSRQVAIDNFLIRKARDIILEKTIQWNIGQTARSIVNSIPEAIKTKFTSFVTEARGKGKKLLRILVPLLIGLKLKMVTLSGIAAVVIGVLAKKAILASLISLVVSGYIGLKKLLAPPRVNYEEVHQVGPGWKQSNISPMNAWIEYDSNAESQIGQQIPYTNYNKR